MVINPLPFSSHRIAWSRAMVILVIAYALIAPAPSAIAGVLLDLFELMGFGLLIIAALGRLWCLSYIAGIKNDMLVTEGPYSVVRNPLYIFNFIGAVGFGFAIESPIAAAALGAGFAIFYPAVVRQEEAALTQAFTERFTWYCAMTSRWLPHWSKFREPESWTISPRQFRIGLLDAMWFLWAFMLWEILEEFGVLQWTRQLL
jgi:protein-S-isoprenylcysteine O-methyltransferase Ste14